MAKFENWLKQINPFMGVNWQEVGSAYKVFKSDPGAGILHIIEAARHSNWQKWVKQRLAWQAANLQGIDVQINISELSKLPENTLGGAYARHITSQGFDPEAFVTPTDADNWLNKRMALSHDVHHVITGFNGSPVGEFGLAAFVLMQYRDMLNVFVLSHAPWFAIGYPGKIPALIDVLIRGFYLGWKCKPIIAYSFEQNWSKPLTEVRRELGIGDRGLGIGDQGDKEDKEDKGDRGEN